ncbi:DUF6126 family protein [Streptomyces sp. NPDC058662]|uniref:DUF6126 family protein n=1 Tax=Streptomyces sp. NPDC058662 TaxID=3346583 RepID=UPI003661F898
MSQTEHQAQHAPAAPSATAAAVGTRVAGGTAAAVGTAAADEAAEAQGATIRARIESKFPRGLVIRLIAYLFVGHLFAFFVYLLFVLGAENQ